MPRQSIDKILLLVSIILKHGYKEKLKIPKYARTELISLNCWIGMWIHEQKVLSFPIHLDEYLQIDKQVC